MDAFLTNQNCSLTTIVDIIYPIGSIYLSINPTPPQQLFGGEWEQIKDRFLLSAGDTYAAGNAGGEATHTLTVGEMPSHHHQYMRQKALNAETDMPDDGTVYASSTAISAFKRTVNTYNTGGGAAHNNMPPYLTVYMWKRTA